MDTIANEHKTEIKSAMSSRCAMITGKRRSVCRFLFLAWCSLIFPLRNSAYVLTKPMVPSGSINTGIRSRGRGVREGIRNNLSESGFSGMQLGKVEDLLDRGTERLLGLNMVFDQLDPRARSKLVGRTYASDPALFEDLAMLKKRSTWTDPLIFCDQAASSPTTGGALASGAVRSIVAVLGFYLFPELTNILSPLMFTKDVVLSDEVRVGLTSSFLPGVSLLFGALFSYTISLLVNRLTKIEEIVNAELAALYVLVMQLQDFFRYDRTDLAACMEAFWRHTDSLIFQSRYQEILLLVQDDPLEDILKMIISVDDDMLAEEERSRKSGVDRDLLSYLRGVTADLIKLRMTRLSYEGRVLPPAHFGILVILASMLLFGFTLASTRPPSPEGLVQTAFESQVLFTLLLFSFSVLLEFALDLTNPFTGRYKVRRTTTTAILIKIRSEIIAVMGAQHMSNFDEEFLKRKRRALRDFRRNTGMALPLDGQI